MINKKKQIKLNAKFNSRNRQRESSTDDSGLDNNQNMRGNNQIVKKKSFKQIDEKDEQQIKMKSSEAEEMRAFMSEEEASERIDMEDDRVELGTGN